MKRALGILAVAFVLSTSALAQTDKSLLLQKPTISRTQIAFVCAGDLWVAPREGGDAWRLTTGTGIETDPLFSPDGSMIAFTGEYDGNTDVYAVPAAGGVPRRLTFHPGTDVVVGWTIDGKSVLFRSGRNSYSRFARLFTISIDGGFPVEVPLPMAFEGSYSADGSRLAYCPLPRAFTAWKRYRGGRTTSVWLAKLADSSVEKVPRDNSNDFNPMWVEGKVYFLSDRGGAATLFSYDTASKKVTQVVRNDGLDIKSASAGPGAIVYEQFGSLHLLNLKTDKTQKLEIRVVGDIASVRPRFEKVGSRISNGTLSPTGVRAVFEARGEILTVPAEKGDARNLTRTPGAAERDPSWSPDGKWIAYFSDESGEYALHLRDQNGMAEGKKINLGNPPSFYYTPIWSPDSKKIAYTDKRLTLWYVDIEKGAPVKIDTTTYENPWRVFDPSWSPDSRWLTYTKQLKNRLGAVCVYSIETGKSTQVTDGQSDARFASFDKSGKHIYFTASTDAGPTTGWLDMSSFTHRVTRSVYAIVLRRDLPSPLAPESDEEKIAEEKKAAETQPAAAAPSAPAEKPGEKKETVTVSIDFENIGQRILALPIPPRNYIGTSTGKAGTLYLLEGLVGLGGFSTAATVHKFELEKRKTEKVVEGVSAFDVSANGEKMLFRQGERWFIAATAQPLKPGEGILKTEEMEVWVDPLAEWKQMYHEAWRIQRDFFYDPGYHGLDLKAAEAQYARYLPSLSHRADLTYLFNEMLGELSVGHLYVAGGDEPEVKKVKGGLLGADLKIENGRYRFARIYNGENWNPQLRAPLTQPGVNVAAGEYLLSVNGRELRSSDSVYSFFEGTAGKSVVIRVGSDPNGANARSVTVVPVESEISLRNLAWIEDNRRKVDQLSGGKLAYVYLPDTAGGGYTNFNRYYFAQIDKQGAVIDERFNGGGTAADYIIDYMRRPLMSYWATREGEDFTTPVGSIYGPKAMIINEYAGSGGDAMPWYFRKAGVGPLIGKRTWGGLVGIYDYPTLMDGGLVTAPRVAFWSPEGKWDVENAGVSPDIEVDFDPEAWRAGRDPQLEKAIEVVVSALNKNPVMARPTALSELPQTKRTRRKINRQAPAAQTIKTGGWRWRQWRQGSEPMTFEEITKAAAARNRLLLDRYRNQMIELEPKYLLQMAHLTTPATVWKYVESAVTKSKANLVMLDLEDSIPRDNAELLEQGRANVIRAFNELDWGSRLRFFRPRGIELDPAHSDIAVIVRVAGSKLDGLIYPKIESAEEVHSIDETLTALEREVGLPRGGIRIEPLIESASAEEKVFEIARSSKRLVGLVFGSYDYWASLGMGASGYRADHPLIAAARERIVKAAASVGIPAIAEMTTNYPTRDKSDTERRAAIEEFRSDAILARDFGFAGKWTGIPDQTTLAVEIFQTSDEEIERAINEAKQFLQAEASGRGATMIAGKMADRATDRLNRNTLKKAYAMGRLNDALAKQLMIC